MSFHSPVRMTDVYDVSVAKNVSQLSQMPEGTSKRSMRSWMTKSSSAICARFNSESNVTIMSIWQESMRFLLKCLRMLLNESAITCLSQPHIGEINDSNFNVTYDLGIGNRTWVRFDHFNIWHLVWYSIIFPVEGVMQFLQSSMGLNGRPDYRCTLCGRSSWHRGNMKKHMIRMHARVILWGH